MAVNILPTSVIKINLGIEPNGKVQKFATHTCRLYMDKYVPYRKGNLREEVEEGDNYVKYNMPYAHYMYEGILYVDHLTGSSWARKDATKIPTGKKLEYHTAGTGRHWDSLMWTAEKKQVIETIQNYINRRK